MPTYRWITLLSDYGLADGFVAACHGVIARLAPEVRVLDVTHLVPSHDIRRGAAVLAQTVGYLPVPAVHVAVVDPGVGGVRRPVAVESAQGSLFVGPDNGLLPWAVAELGGPKRAVEIRATPMALGPVSSTFHGRDVFAPVAARLAAGLSMTEVGPTVEVESLIRLPTPVSRVNGDAVECEVLLVDTFGNVQTSARLADLTEAGVAPGAWLSVEPGGAAHVMLLGPTFSAVPNGELVAYEDSARHVAFAVNGGSAAGRLGLRPGTPIVVRAIRSDVAARSRR